LKKAVEVAVTDLAESGNYALRPIGIGVILLTVGVGLILSDLLEFAVLSSPQNSDPNFIYAHWFGEAIVLFLVFSLLYYPLKKRRLYRQRLIKALQVSEAQYRTLVEGLDVGIALIDDQRQLIKTNQAMSQFMGEPGCFVSKRKCFELLNYAAGQICSACPGTETLISGDPAVVEMVLPETESGPIKAVRVRTFPVASGEGGIRQFIEVVEDITDEKKSTAEIQRLSRELTSAAEQERKRLARDLHDQCGQVLAGVQYSLEALRTEVAQDLPESSQQFDTISNMIEQIGHNIRQVSTQLHPSVLDDFGLLPTLNWLIEEARRQRKDIDYDFKFDQIPNSLAADFNTTIYRVCQESLNNVSKHSKATRVEISLVCSNDKAFLRVHDNGCGFQSEQVLSQSQPGHIGLHGMRERVQAMGGDLIIKSEPGAGTWVEARIPYTMES